MNIGESDHIDADLGIPTWTQNQRPSDNNQRKRLSIQVMQGENFGLILDGEARSDGAIRFLIGINIGDVIPDGTDVHGLRGKRGITASPNARRVASAYRGQCAIICRVVPTWPSRHSGRST
jgi:hypothetical protein